MVGSELIEDSLRAIFCLHTIAVERQIGNQQKSPQSELSFVARHKKSRALHFDPLSLGVLQTSPKLLIELPKAGIRRECDSNVIGRLLSIEHFRHSSLHQKIG